MKDKTKLAFLMTVLLMSGVSLSSCDNRAKTQIDEPKTETKVVNVPQDTVVAEQQHVQVQTKQYVKATSKVKTKKTNEAKQKIPNRIGEYDKYEQLSPEQIEYLRNQYHTQHTN